MLSFECGVQACWWAVVTICYSSDTVGLKCCLFHLTRVAVLGEERVVVWQGAVKGWGNSCGRAEQQLMQKSLCSWAAVQRQLHSHRRGQTGLFSGRDSTGKLPPPRWALQGATSQDWIQKALRSCSDLYTFINSGRMFTLGNPFFSMAAYKQRPRIIKTALILLYSAWKPDVKQQNIKFLRDSIRWVTLL